MDRLDSYLTLWAAWMRQHPTTLGYPHQASPRQITRSRVTHFEDLEAECDNLTVLTVAALVESLPQHQESSIHTVHLGSIWRFPDEPLEVIYEGARSTLTEGLNRWGLP